MAEVLLHAADVAYFNFPLRPAERLVAIRSRLIDRTMKLRRWKLQRKPHDLSVDFEIGGIVAKLLMNNHNPLLGTTSYLVPAVFDRIDPLLASLRLIMKGGPSAFISVCTMNLLMVAPRARHIDFLLSAVEEWLHRSEGDHTMWSELEIGKKVIDWLTQVSIENPELLDSKHPFRNRMDAVLGSLVGFGVPQAHEFEERIEVYNS